MGTAHAHIIYLLLASDIVTHVRRSLVFNTSASPLSNFNIILSHPGTFSFYRIKILSLCAQHGGVPLNGQVRYIRTRTRLVVKGSTICENRLFWQLNRLILRRYKGGNELLSPHLLVLGIQCQSEFSNVVNLLVKP